MYKVGFYISKDNKPFPSMEDVQEITRLAFQDRYKPEDIQYVSNWYPQPYKDKTIKKNISRFESVKGLDFYIFFIKTHRDLTNDGLTLLSQCITHNIPYIKTRIARGPLFEVHDWQLADARERIKEKLILDE